MMIRRPLRPTFSAGHRDDLLNAMEQTRRLAILLGASVGYNTKLHHLTHELSVAIDALATDLTGDPTYYHSKMSQSRKP